MSTSWSNLTVILLSYDKAGIFSMGFLDDLSKYLASKGVVVQKSEAEPVRVIEHIRKMNLEELAGFLSITFCHGYGQKELERWLWSVYEEGE